MSNVTLKDEGIYRCLLYDNKVISKTFKVKVLGKYIYFSSFSKTRMQYDY